MKFCTGIHAPQNVNPAGFGVDFSSGATMRFTFVLQQQLDELL